MGVGQQFKLILLVLGLLCLSSAANAEDKVSLISFEGPKASVIEKDVKTLLENRGYELVSVSSADEEPEANAVIRGVVKKKKKRWSLVVEVLNLDGSVKGKTTFKARKIKGLRKMVKAKLWKRVGDFIESESADEMEPDNSNEEPTTTSNTTEKGNEDKPEEVARVEASAEPELTADKRSLEASLSIGTQIINRRFNYKDDLRQSLATYDISAMTAFAIEGDVYPIEQLGVAASYSYTPSFNSGLNGNSNEPFPTTHRTFLAGVRGRFKAGSLFGRIDLDYGGQNFTIKGALASSTPIPNLRYRFVRGGASTRVASGDFYAALSGGYRHVLSTGEISEDAYFPRLDVAGVDGRVVLGYELFSGWNVELAATMERYFFTMNPEVGDPLIAGGAVDFYQGGQISIRYQL